MSVLRVIESARLDRAVQIVERDGGFGWVECRRDPEGGEGWERLTEVNGSFADADEAEKDARHVVGWMAQESSL